MISSNIFNIRGFRLFLVIVAVNVLLLCAASASGENLQSFMPGAPVPLILDPTVSTFRVPPASRPQGIRPASTAVITVSYVPAGSYGTWDDLCEDWPADAKTAFEYAAGIWAGYLNSSVPIVVEACWTDMGSSYILGHGGAVNLWYDSPPQSWAPVTNTFYPAALANALSGTDIDESIGEPAPEIAVAFNKTFNWYFATDGHPVTSVDFASVVFHEICHGLGFLGTIQGNSPVAGQARWGWGSGIPAAYDRFAVNNLGQSLINTGIFGNPSTQLYGQVTGGNVYFNGPNARAANGNNNAKLYAPATWSSGSSYAHLDEVFNGTANALMTYSLSSGEAVHAPGPVTLGILEDIGWSINPSCSYTLGSTGSSFDLDGGSGTVDVTVANGCGWTAVSNALWIDVTSGAPGSGSGTVGYSVESYTGTGSRTGTMTIAGQSFTVTQTGCSYTLSPDHQTLNYSGGPGSFWVTTQAICPRSATESLDWVAIDSSAGTGSGTVSYSVDAYAEVTSRSGNINVANKTFVVTQTGVPPVANFSANPTTGTAPFQVVFTDSSTKSPTSWLWDFGDGETSTLQNPVHTYKTTTGSPPTVSLTSTNANGSNSITQSAYITIDPCGNSPVMRAGNPNTSIQASYDELADSGTDTIYIQAVDFTLTEALTFGANKTVTLMGGYACDYNDLSRIPGTTVIGSIIISDAEITFDRIAIR